MEGTNTYPVRSPVLFDRRYEPDDTITLSPADAGPLLAAGAIGEATAVTAPSANSKPPTAAELIEQIKAAATVADVDAILGSDNRVTVVAAATARRAELASE